MNHPVRVLLIASPASADPIRAALLVPNRVERLAPYELETTGSVASAAESIRRDALPTSFSSIPRWPTRQRAIRSRR
ncbi:MAG TPA: hypothetical protein VNJ04_00445 [Gemmatimonadaceae bacterium]|nr:hypothetical protein [Gemmatimonadaceae bacterium]